MSASDTVRLRIFGSQRNGTNSAADALAEDDRVIIPNEPAERDIDDAVRSVVSSDVPVVAEAAAEPDDETLLHRMKSADMEALGQFFRRHSRMMLGVARRVLRDDHEAEDLVQDVFLSLFFKSGTFDAARGSARSWLIQVTYHRAYDRRRYLNARSFYDGTRNAAAISGLTAPPGSALEDPEQFFAWRSHLRSAFEELSEDQRKTLTLYFYEGYTIQEISERLGQSFGNVQHHYYRGMDRLRKYVFGKSKK